MPSQWTTLLITPQNQAPFSLSPMAVSLLELTSTTSCKTHPMELPIFHPIPCALVLRQPQQLWAALNTSFRAWDVGPVTVSVGTFAFQTQQSETPLERWRDATSPFPLTSTPECNNTHLLLYTSMPRTFIDNFS